MGTMSSLKQAVKQMDATLARTNATRALREWRVDTARTTMTLVVRRRRKGAGK
jgi:hypothetical protein